MPKGEMHGIGRKIRNPNHIFCNINWTYIFQYRHHISKYKLFNKYIPMFNALRIIFRDSTK